MVAGEEEPPGWAIEQAEADLYDVRDRPTIIRRAWELSRDADERHDERHDEYDDPDEGGES